MITAYGSASDHAPDDRSGGHVRGSDIDRDSPCPDHLRRRRDGMRAIVLDSMFAASMQEDRTARTRADEHGLTVCHPNTTCRDARCGDVACAGVPNEDVPTVKRRDPDGRADIESAVRIGRPAGRCFDIGFSAVIGGGFLVVLGMLTNGLRGVRQHDVHERARIDKAIRAAEAQTAKARAAEAKARSDG